MKLAWGCSYELRETTDTWQGEEHLALHNDAAEAPHVGQAAEERTVRCPGWILFFLEENTWLDGKGPTEKLDYAVVFPEQSSCYRRDATTHVRVWASPEGKSLGVRRGRLMQ